MGIYCHHIDGILSCHSHIFVRYLSDSHNVRLKVCHLYVAYTRGLVQIKNISSRDNSTLLVRRLKLLFKDVAELKDKHKHGYLYDQLFPHFLIFFAKKGHTYTGKREKEIQAQ